jgi:hypothetical protein
LGPRGSEETRARATEPGLSRRKKRILSHSAPSLRLRPAMKPTARTRSWLAHCLARRSKGGPKPRHSGSCAAPYAMMRLPAVPRRRRRSGPPGPARPDPEARAATRQTTRQAQPGVNQQGEDSAGGARHPEVGRPRSRPHGPPSKTPRSVRKDRDRPGPKGPAWARPATGAPTERRGPGTSPARLDPRPAGRKAKGGVRGSANFRGRGRPRKG